MAYPVLAPQNTWFAPTVSTVTKASITEIEIKDSYTPDASVTVVDSWDASEAKDGSITCYVIGTKLIMAGNGSGKIAANADSKMAFSGTTNYRFLYVTTITAINLLDVSNVVDMSTMFGNFRALTTLDLSSWDVSNVTNMSTMFGNCNELIALNLQNWDVSKVTNMSAMFMYCYKLYSLDLSNWNVSNVTNMSMMFAACNNLISTGNLDNWNVSKVTDMYYMFNSCIALTSIGDLSNWDVSSVTRLKGMFNSCEVLTSIGDLSNWNISKVINDGLTGLFKNCNTLTSVGNLSDWDISNVTDLMEVFSGCKALQSLDLSNWNTSNITKMNGMFQECHKLTDIGNLVNWDTSYCTNMSFMFYGCYSLKELDLSNWNVSKVTNLDHFAAHAGLYRKGIENWKTTSLVNANAAFHNCAEEELDLSGWDVSKVQFFCQMFENSPNLKHIKGLEKWDTSSGLGFDGMFERCYKLEEVDLSSFNTAKAKNNVSASSNGHTTATLQNMLLSCNNLKKVTLGPNFSVNGDGTNTAAGNKLVLPTPSASYIEGADGNWYTFTGDSHAPNAVKDKTAETYYASYDIVANMDVICKNRSLIDAAKAIREKSGSSEHYIPSEFGAAIRALT